MLEESSSSVTIRSADRDRVERALDDYLADLFGRHPEVTRVVWFGSWVTGIPAPGSDVDLCLVLDRAEDSPRHRIPRYLPDGFPVGIDLFPYTEEELALIQRDRPEWHRCLTTGKQVTRRDWESGRKPGRKLREEPQGA